MIAKAFRQWYTQLINASTESFRIPTHIFDRYEGYIKFKCNFHNVLISSQVANGNTKSIIPFCITKRDIMDGVAHWPTKYQLPLSEVQEEFELFTKNLEEHNRVVASTHNHDKVD
jgi:hypothetical protein